MERILLWVSENQADGETADGRDGHPKFLTALTRPTAVRHMPVHWDDRDRLFPIRHIDARRESIEA